MNVATRRSLHLPNEGVLSLSIRNDAKLLAAGGKDGKYGINTPPGINPRRENF